ncbi:hypothetical protein DVA76_19955, partial [Acinetobacter baumannii]
VLHQSTRDTRKKIIKNNGKVHTSISRGACGHGVCPTGGTRRRAEAWQTPPSHPGSPSEYQGHEKKKKKLKKWQSPHF